MSKSKKYIIIICGIALIGFGIFDIVLNTYPTVIMFKNKYSVASDKVNIFLSVGNFIVFLFSFHFILTGIGVLRLKNWARKAGMWTTGIHALFFVIPSFITVTGLTIRIEHIGLTGISLLLIFTLLNKSIKEQFVKVAR